MADPFLTGILAGFAIAMPVGPVGLMCIGNTLKFGRTSGLATGFGAALADGTYGLLVALGVSALGVLSLYESPMQFFGGLLIVWLGLRSMVKYLHAPEPVDDFAPPPPAGHPFWTFTGTYVITLSNPATILAFLGMIAGLGASAASGPWAAYALVAGVTLGSAIWWLILVELGLFAKGRFPLSRMRLLDLISGIILIGWGGTIAISALTKLL